MPVLPVSENKTKARIIDYLFSNDEKPVNHQQSDILSPHSLINVSVPTSSEAKTNNGSAQAFNEKKFYFPPFNVKHRAQNLTNKAEQPPSIFAEKIKNHSVDDPHYGHKHYHKHEYHHLPSHHDSNHLGRCTYSMCTERDENPGLDYSVEFKFTVKARDSVIIHEAPLQTTKLRVQNICCPKEARIVQDELGKLPGIDTIRVNVLGRVAYISHDQDQVTPPEMLETLNKRHLGASIMDAGAEQEVDRGFPKNLKILLAILTVQAVLFGVALGVMFSHATWYMWVAIAQICFGMLPVLKKCYHALYHLQIDLNILITVTVIGTLGIQQWIEGAAVVFIFILANFLQEYCFYRVHKTISSLMLSKPSKAVLACTGEVVPIENVSIGSIIAVRQGELIPLDGVVVKGSASVDESSISGEAVPVEKTLKSKAYSGTVIQHGYLELKTSSSAASSTISKVAALVQDAQLNASPTEIMMNKFASYYTPLIVLLAAIVFLVPVILHLCGAYGGSIKTWGERALIVLVTACPCALLMATPIVVICGISGGARLGTLIKGGTFLEALSRIEFLGFDKTGTLTEGKFQVVDLVSVNKDEEKDVMRRAAALESKSSHPLAAAVVTQFTGECIADFVNDVKEIQLPDVSNFRTVEGQGISGVVEGHFIDIGNPTMLGRLGVKLDSEFEAEYDRLCAESKTVVFVCVDEQLALMVSLADIIREESHLARIWLQDLGVHLAMLTGDSKETANAVQKQLKLDSCVSEMKPDDKLKWITNVKEENTIRMRRFCGGQKVPATGMVGDGVNDGPALATADVGIAMAAGGSALAVEAAGVAIMTNSVLKVPEMICLSRFCRRLIIENIVLAIFLKLVFVVVAIMGYVEVWMAVFADLAGLLMVILNGLRPLIWKPPRSNPTADETPRPSWIQRRQPGGYKQIQDDGP